MDLKSTFADPAAAPSVLWAALKKAHPTVAAWEPETIRLELKRRGVEPSDAVMAKVLGAQTVEVSDAWLTDHDVLFAFALACDGVPAAADAFHHPTVEQLAWAMHELAAIRGARPDADEGFDPDAVDPAVAALLLDAGFVNAPEELAFAEDVLDRMRADHDDSLDARVAEAWRELAALPAAALRSKAEGLEETAVNVQLQRLAEVRLYVTEKARARSEQHGVPDLGAG